MFIIHFIHPFKRDSIELICSCRNSVLTIVELLKIYQDKKFYNLKSIHFTVLNSAGTVLYPKDFQTDETNFWQDK